MTEKKALARTALCTALAAALTACGGGGSDNSTAIPISSVKVMGDSLADSGTFGFKFTVQDTGPLVYPERVAASYGVSLCNHYTATSATTFVPNPTQAGCTNYAVGGGRINNFTAPTSPVSIQQQLTDASANGNYSATDLVIIDGGGNDASDLVGAYLQASTDGGAAYAGLLGTLLPPATIGAAAAAGQSGLEAVGATYMTALADAFAATITSTTLGKGATHVALLNMPGITNTPRFQMVLDGIAQAYGGGATGAAARAHSLAVFNGWITAFNTELAAKFAGNSSVVVVDFYTSFNDEIANPAMYSLQNVTTPACPVTGTDASNLPTYTFASCTAAALSAQTPPAGATGGANWWQTYAFADSFHPTPYGHSLLARYISRALSAAGWL